MRNLRLIAATAICWGVFSATAANANTIVITPQDDAANNNLVTVTTTGSIIALQTRPAGRNHSGVPPLPSHGQHNECNRFCALPGRFPKH